MGANSRISMRHTGKGVTIRATGSAAQALFDAITHGAETVQAIHALLAKAEPPLRLVRLVKTILESAQASAADDKPKGKVKGKAKKGA